ncbi:hypothetical protein LEP3755_63670 (plasmid) [Leptolyngbya sp. NIES-3755]|nr:hypothetical protein LEP3755_63670 [Leptolyngbya sp. NIES-3755]
MGLEDGELVGFEFWAIVDEQAANPLPVTIALRKSPRKLKLISFIFTEKSIGTAKSTICFNQKQINTEYLGHPNRESRLTFTTQ